MIYFSLNFNVDGHVEVETKAGWRGSFLASDPKAPGAKPISSQAEWAPFELPTEKTDYIDGVRTLGGNGDAGLRDGIALHIYAINASMDRRAILNADGDCMIVAQLGHIVIQTEMGRLYLQPGELAVVQRGIKYRVALVDGHEHARGYIIELFGSRWELPTLGPLGCFGLANPRDFLAPVAYIDDKLDDDWLVFTKIHGSYSVHKQSHSPFDVAAWHGNCVPYKVCVANKRQYLITSTLKMCTV